MAALLGRKIGMTGIFTEDGAYMPCTLIEVGPCTVVQVKTSETDGYDAIQLGFGKKKEKSVNRPTRGHVERAGLSDAPSALCEFRTFKVADYKAGDVIKAGDVFASGDLIHVAAVSKGKGFQGVVRRHGFSGVGMRSHGQHNRERAPGSIGQSSYPSRVFPGTRMAGRMGGKRSTVRNLQVMAVDAENNIMIVKGSVPGAQNALVEIKKANQ